MKFSLIICGYNEDANLDLCIASCLEQSYPKDKYEILYIDNNSTDDSISIASKYPIKVFSEKKQGLSEARNCGIRNSTGEILVFLDADLKLDKNYLEHHEKTFNDTAVGAGGGCVLPLVKTWVSNYVGVALFEYYPRYKVFKYVRTYPGCNLTIRREVINKVGIFLEGLKTPAGITRFAEDKEMCERLRRAGYLIRYNPEAVVYHKNIYEFKTLARSWYKGSRSRADMIKTGKKDPFSLLFKYNIPLLSIAVILLTLLLTWKLTIALVVFCAAVLFGLGIKSFLDTGLFMQSLLVKPVLDSVSLMVINSGVLFSRLRESKANSSYLDAKKHL